MQTRKLYSLHFTLFIILTLCLLTQSIGVESARAAKERNWRYIIIHHSATRTGNARIVDRYHRNHRHMKNGLAYHFVINNGTSGRRDGQVEVGHRWKRQLAGGHVKQQWLNNCAIGICLIGNFNRQYITKKQFEELVKLVNKLRKTYNIPMRNIRGHGDFGGERTVCPGKKFPMRKLKKRLRASS